MADELEILKKLTYKTLSEAELLDIFYDNRDNYRVKLNLVMQPRFPEKYALDIISHLFAVDLLRVAKNKRVNPFVRRRVELEFSIKYQRFPLGEKLSYMRIAPPSLMEYFIEEHDRRVLEAMLKNPLCTENLVLRFIHRRSPRHDFYEALLITEWYKRPNIAETIANDSEAPIRILTEIIPYLSKRTLQRLYESPDTHRGVRNNIIYYIESRGNEAEPPPEEEAGDS